ncbi:efflux RND transporter periplasmic adaptor subunit [Microbulbifer sp. THAF38]|uniref:efflux RND transporter periplasmic adaptor subunit n=1 Tax=Microbulbifer sp. THAF38 TaxID=2587856 RepID=UPI0012A92783|nr:efflux RND transporter periplasmic adaptor subunit [Microbulbifer sp. THAF38]QFT55057.1 Multidrug resistance protein MdtN [Microbulbifer sp. THAF38]
MNKVQLKKLMNRRLALPTLVAVGVLISMALVMSKNPPIHDVQDTLVTPVHAVKVQELPLRARAVAYGEVKPSTFLEANAEVSGRVVYTAPELERGNMIPAGTLVLKIDDTSYQLALAKAESDLAANRANLQELKVEEANSQRSLEIAERTLKLGEKELERKQKLVAKGTVSRSSVDVEEQNVLRLRQEVQNQTSQLSLFPTRRKVIEAQIARAEAQVRDSKYNLERTQVILPFDARIGDVYVEENQYVAGNARLFDASGLDQVEIAAELPMVHVAPLLRNLRPSNDRVPTPEDLPKMLVGLEARITLVGGPGNNEWQGRVVRLGGTLDSTSRTLSVVVAVDDPYGEALAGNKPPLFRGMYSRVELFAPAASALAIPRRALHEGRVYLVEDGQLRLRSVQVDYHQGDTTVIREGLNPGEQVIVTDVIPAIDGMAVSVSGSQQAVFVNTGGTQQ